MNVLWIYNLTFEDIVFMTELRQPASSNNALQCWISFERISAVINLEGEKNKEKNLKATLAGYPCTAHLLPPTASCL